MKQKIIKFCTTAMIISSGALLSSLIIFPSDNWKGWLVLFLMCCSLKATLEE